LTTSTTADIEGTKIRTQTQLDTCLIASATFEDCWNLLFSATTMYDN